MTRIAPDPLAGIGRLVVDGTNLLGALRRGPDSLPPAALVGRLRSAVPAEVVVEIVFDGHSPGGGVQRAASGVFVRFAGRRTADEVILELAEPEGMLVVTDDRELRERLGSLGSRTTGTAWLVRRLGRGRLAAPSAGNARPPLPQPGGARDREEPEESRRPWKPGRGATRKRGNPKPGRSTR